MSAVRRPTTLKTSTFSYKDSENTFYNMSVNKETKSDDTTKLKNNFRKNNTH